MKNSPSGRMTWTGMRNSGSIGMCKPDATRRHPTCAQFTCHVSDWLVKFKMGLFLFHLTVKDMHENIHGSFSDSSNKCKPAPLARWITVWSYQIESCTMYQWFHFILGGLTCDTEPQNMLKVITNGKFLLFVPGHPSLITVSTEGTVFGKLKKKSLKIQ